MVTHVEVLVEEPSAEAALQLLLPRMLGALTYERILKRAGYFQTGLRKIEAARAVGAHMAPERNTSPSFCALRDALHTMVSP